jgi:hypothetical protein
MEQMAKREPGRSSADDRDLRASTLSCHTKEASGVIPLAVRGVRCRHRRLRLMTEYRRLTTEASGLADRPKLLAMSWPVMSPRW